MSVTWAPRARMAVRLVTGGVDEGNRAGGAVLSLDRDLVGADVLGDATVLGVDDVRVTDGVEQLRLTVVDVTHDGDDRGSGHHILGVVEFFGLEVDIEDSSSSRSSSSGDTTLTS